jgi:hypothetical protein
VLQWGRASPNSGRHELTSIHLRDPIAGAGTPKERRWRVERPGVDLWPLHHPARMPPRTPDEAGIERPERFLVLAQGKTCRNAARTIFGTRKSARISTRFAKLS